MSSATPVDWRMALLLFVAVLALSIPQAALLPLLDRDEPRFAEASREMLQSGNFIVPTFNGAPRYAKPPLIYWCQVASYTIIGENAFAARLPSLFATAATACLLYTWGIRLGSAAVGLGAALSYAFCLQTVQQGRVATADALLIFFMTLTAFAGWLILRPKTPGRSLCACYAVLALGFAGGFLAKGPEAWLPFLPLLWCAFQTERGTALKLIGSFLVSLVLVLVWAVPAYVETHGDYWRIGLNEGVGQRMVTGLQGHGASSFGWYLLGLPLYFLLFWLSALPWSPLLVLHRKKLFRAWKPDFADIYLLLNAALIFLIFTLMVTKLPHYTLPAFPFVALLLAKRGKVVGLSLVFLTELGWIAGIGFALLAAFIPIAMASHASPSPVGELVHAAGNSLKPGTEFALVDFQEPTAIWEMRGISKKFGQSISDEEVLSFLNQSGPRATVLSSDHWRRFKLLPANFQSDLKVYEARGFNAAKGSFIDLTLVVKP
jgi:4-amino-4-deoxy-L-arabinose transferase-like glycosyltransferase